MGNKQLDNRSTNPSRVEIRTWKAGFDKRDLECKERCIPKQKVVEVESYLDDYFKLWKKMYDDTKSAKEKSLISFFLEDIKDIQKYMKLNLEKEVKGGTG